MEPPQFGEILRQGAPERQLEIPAPIAAKLDVEQTHLEYVAGLSALDIDRAGQQMRTGAAKSGRQYGLVVRQDAEA